MTATPKTATYYFVRTVVILFMALTAVISFMHIVRTSAMLGLTWERWTVPFLIDGFAGLGLIGRSERFAASTRRVGTAITVGSGLLSLACNVMAGSTVGGRIYGVLIVAVFITAEWYGTKLAPATAEVDEPAPAAPIAVVAQPSVAPAAPAKASKGQPWSPERRARHEAKRAAKQAVADEIAALEDALKLASAPVSPAPGEAAAYL